MEPKEKVTALIELANAKLDKYKQTRDLQFKVNISLWTLIVLVGYKCEDTLALTDLLDYVFYSVVAISIVLGHYYFWLRPLSKSMAPDNASVLEFHRQAEKIINDSSETPKESLGEIRSRYGIMNYFLAGITLLLLVLLGIFLGI